MATIPELLDGHVTLEVECLDRLYLNVLHRQAGDRAWPGLLYAGSVRKTDSVALRQISEKLREAVKSLAEQEGIPVYQFRHKERKDEIANRFRHRRNVRDGFR